MKKYEVICEIPNLCGNNQMRDVSFREIETDDPVAWVKNEVRGSEFRLETDKNADGDLTVYVESTAISRKYVFSAL